jgi:hypothetical protein
LPWKYKCLANGVEKDTVGLREEGVSYWNFYDDAYLLCEHVAHTDVDESEDISSLS